MEKDDTIILFLSFVILINLITIILLLNLSFDLSGKIDILENDNMKLKQNNTELEWELDQVDEMICTNEELNYEQN